MFKLLGAAFVVFAGTMLGFYQALQLARRPKQIRQLLQTLKRLETEIHFAGTRLPDALRSAARGCSAPIRSMLEHAASLLEQTGGSTEESWCAAIDQGWPRTSMRQSEREVWQALGASLGGSDRDDQLKHLRLAAAHLQTEETNAAEERKRLENVWKSLGVLGGALLVILMY